MEASLREIHVYVTSKGESPFLKWLQSLSDAKGRAIARVRLDRIRLGNIGDVKPVGGGVSELRIDYGPGYRVYFGQIGNRIVILLCGGTKASQAKDISRAQQYWLDYRRREDD